jgi:8-oxo-dGTP diphosphatase
LYNGIGGHIEAGEDILEAAQRELNEETGISQVELSICGQIMIDVSPERGISIFLFRGDYSGDDLISSREGQLSWVDLNQLDDITPVEDLAYLLPLIADYQLGDPLIIGKYRYTDSGELIISFR